MSQITKIVIILIFLILLITTIVIKRGKPESSFQTGENQYEVISNKGDGNALNDSLLLAVSFGLTGTYSTKVDVIDRNSCIFKLNETTYFLNEVYKDRVMFKELSHNILIELHGDNKIYEYMNINKIPVTDDDKLIKELGKKYNVKDLPDGLVTKSDVDLYIPTKDFKLLIRAWQYIYDNGCVGKKSPF